jgi:hypothetical protein
VTSERLRLTLQQHRDLALDFSCNMS